MFLFFVHFDNNTSKILYNKEKTDMTVSEHHSTAFKHGRRVAQ